MSHITMSTDSVSTDRVSTTSTKQGPFAVGGRTAVPWATVVPLAVVMSYADGYWLTSLRGAVGAIERTQRPFVSWFRESTLVLPIFALAVIAALTLSLRLFGPVLRKARTVLATMVLISVAGAVAGIGEIAASSAYDYHLQSIQLKMMDAMQGCVGGCVADQQHATLMLQIHAVLYASGMVLITNVVLVAWIVAMWGGRLNVSAIKRSRDRDTRRTSADEAAAYSDPAGRQLRSADTADDTDTPPGGRARDVRMLVVAGLFASAVVHTAVVPAQLSKWPAAGAFFMLLGAAEVALASKLLMQVKRSTLLAVAAVCAGPLVLWLYTRTAGLPFGPGQGLPEAIGLTDCVACALAATTLLAAIVLLRTRGRLLRRPAVSTHVRTMALVAVTAATIIGLAGTNLQLIGDFASTANQSTHVHAALRLATVEK